MTSTSSRLRRSIKGIAALVLALGATCVPHSVNRSIVSTPKKWSQEMSISGGGVTAIACSEPWPEVKDRQPYDYEQERETALWYARLRLSPYTRHPITGANPFERQREEEERRYWEGRNIPYTPRYRGEYAYAYPIGYQDNLDGTSCVKVYLPLPQ